VRAYTFRRSGLRLSAKYRSAAYGPGVSTGQARRSMVNVCPAQLALGACGATAHWGSSFFAAAASSSRAHSTASQASWSSTNGAKFVGSFLPPTILATSFRRRSRRILRNLRRFATSSTAICDAFSAKCSNSALRIRSTTKAAFGGLTQRIATSRVRARSKAPGRAVQAGVRRLATLTVCCQVMRSSSVSLATRSCGSSALLTRYSRSSPSAGSSCVTL
jgi:hypothetical protein